MLLVCALSNILNYLRLIPWKIWNGDFLVINKRMTEESKKGKKKETNINCVQ